MIMCVLLCYPVSIHMSQLLSTGRPISRYYFVSNSVLSYRLHKERNWQNLLQNKKFIF